MAESEGQIIYVVTAGEYSSYYICGVYSTEEKAFAVAESVGGTVEYYPLDDIDRGILAPRMVEIDKHGNVRPNGYLGKITSSQVQSFITRDGVGRFSVIARSQDHAIKAANEIRGQLLAMDRWVSGPVEHPMLWKPPAEEAQVQ